MRERTVLIVDHETTNELDELVRALGFDALHATTQEDAWAAVKNGGFDVVLLDLELKLNRDAVRPRVDAGLTLLRDIRRTFPARTPLAAGEVPVIAMSANAQDHHQIVEAMTLGANGFLVKPLDERAVRTAIEDAVQRSYPNDAPPASTRLHSAMTVRADIAGNISKGRTEVIFDNEHHELPQREFEILLTLLVATTRGGAGWVDVHTIAASAPLAHKAISRLKEKMSPRLRALDLFENDRGGKYRLNRVMPGTIRYDVLQGHESARVRTLAMKMLQS